MALDKDSKTGDKDANMSKSASVEIKSSLYRAVWRWHFFAGLAALPFLLILAITGGLYLFHDEIDHLLYRAMEDAPAVSGAPAPLGELVRRTEAATQSEVTQIVLPSDPGRSIQMQIKTASGESRTAFVNPGDGALLGSIPAGGVMQIVRKLHSLQYFGFWASCLIEIAAGWTVILALSGLYLWWPRGARGGVVSIRATPRSRVFWRDLHAVTGMFASALILFLAVTGMPWSKVWGKYVQEWTTAAGLGRPEPPAGAGSPWGDAGKAKSGHVHGEEGRANLPWALEKTVPPTSLPTARQTPSITLDQALAAFAAAGLQRPLNIMPPRGPNGVYTASYRPDRVELTRTVYLDRYTGRIVGDTGYADYGPAAKAIEWGIAVHQGQEYGFVNRYVMLAGCLAIVLLVISAPVMWWKRRPQGSLGVPPEPSDRRAARGVLAIMAIGGVLFPLTGLSMLAALACERLFEIGRGFVWRRFARAAD